MRIDSILLQLSGLVPSGQSKMSLLQALFKEYRHELSVEEEEYIINLFNFSFTKENMEKGRTGYMNNKLEYHPSETSLNQIESELRSLLGVHGFYKITRENKDYQIGVE